MLMPEDGNGKCSGRGSDVERAVSVILSLISNRDLKIITNVTQRVREYVRMILLFDLNSQMRIGSGRDRRRWQLLLTYPPPSQQLASGGI